MEIKRFNCDFGNSTSNFLVDGYYFEIPTNVVEISEKKALEMFVNPISEPKELLNRIMISTEIEGKEKYYLVGELAELSKLSNNHVNKMHDKIKSPVPYASFLAAVGYYNALNSDSKEEADEIEIEYMSMMLPIWLLKKGDKFSAAMKEMEARFLKEHTVKIKTLGMEKEIKITVKKSKCKIESEVARHALKYRMVSSDDSKTISIEKRKEANKFSENEVVLIDLGGGTIDAAKLGKGLTPPQSSESFKVIDMEPYLGRLDTLRMEKFLQQFNDVRALEKFIILNYSKHQYILNDENTGKEFDFTEPITETLRDYSDIVISKILSSFKPEGNEVLKFIYFGGEAPILEKFLKESLLKHMTEKALQNNHYFISDIIEDDPKEIFKPTSRTINLTALEILSLDELKSE
jgi:plasmid segregation protein ParM